jgi:putative ATPase
MRSLGYGEGYRYDHDEPGAVSGQSGLPSGIGSSTFYRPSPRGFEVELKRRMEEIDRYRAGERTKKKPGSSGGPGSC